MTPDTPSLPMTPATPVEEPKQGGSYLRAKDGTLTRVQWTRPPTEEERADAKRKALGLDDAAPQPAPEQ